MRDLDERLPRILNDLAGEVRPDPATRRRVLDRARRRRVLTAATSAVVAVGLVAGAYAGTRSILDEPRSVLGGDPNPSPAIVDNAEPFKGIWPETDAQALAEAQAQVNDGHQPWRTDPEFTAATLAVGLFAWEPDTVDATMVRHLGGTALVVLHNSALVGTVNREGAHIEVELEQLGVTGPNGIWTVVAVSSPALTIDMLPDVVRPGDHLGLAATIWPPKMPGEVVASLLDGPVLDDAVSGTFERRDDRAIGEVAVPTSADGTLTLLVRVIGPHERTVAAFATTIRVEGTDAPPTGTTGEQAFPLPDAVVDTRARILEAALAHDLEALRALLDPNHFAYNFDDGSDPTPEWEADPSVLDTLATILQMPPAIRHTPESGDFYVWPYLSESDLTSLTAVDREHLERLGIGEGELEDMIEFGAYIGPRTTIAPDGTWLNYVTGGD